MRRTSRGSAARASRARRCSSTARTCSRSARSAGRRSPAASGPTSTAWTAGSSTWTRGRPRRTATSTSSRACSAALRVSTPISRAIGRTSAWPQNGGPIFGTRRTTASRSASTRRRSPPGTPATCRSRTRPELPAEGQPGRQLRLPRARGRDRAPVRLGHARLPGRDHDHRRPHRPDPPRRARRPSYPFESWTIIVTTDHGQRPLDEPSLVSHLSQTPLEITSFLIGAGPGLGQGEEAARSWTSRRPSSTSSGCRSRRGSSTGARSRAPAARSSPPRPARGRLGVTLRLAQPRAGAKAVVVRLPAGVRVTAPPRWTRT